MLRFICVMAMLVMFAGGCAQVPRAKHLPEDRRTQERNYGYALLYELMANQRQLPMIFILKAAPTETRDLCVGIGVVSRDLHVVLTDWAKEDDTLGYDQDGLPWFEQATRAAIEATQRDQLMNSTGRAFELRLLLTQSDSLAYASHLCKMLADVDLDEQRVAELEHWQIRFEDLREKVIARLLALQDN